MVSGSIMLYLVKAGTLVASYLQPLTALEYEQHTDFSNKYMQEEGCKKTFSLDMGFTNEATADYFQMI